MPFERQVVRNESLPEGQQRLVQAGVNGQQEVTYRSILEDGVETSRSIVKTVVLQDTMPEIVMVGAQASFAPLPIPGKIAYLAGGNAWIMDTSTANRRLLVNTGDLDGRILSLSPDGGYLLFTRKSKKPADQQINTLWAVSTKSATPNPIWLKAANVVHFAAWYPEWVEHGRVLHGGTARHGSRLAGQQRSLQSGSGRRTRRRSWMPTAAAFTAGGAYRLRSRRTADWPTRGRTASGW